MSMPLVGAAFAVPISHRFYANTLELALQLQGQYNKLYIIHMSMPLALQLQSHN
jgi:hypothetical protein